MAVTPTRQEQEMEQDQVVYDDDLEVYRVQSGSTWVGSEYGGNPLAFDTHAEAEDMVERRADLRRRG